MSRYTSSRSISPLSALPYSTSLGISSWHLHQTKDVIQQGGVIAYPTEAVWGLGCDPTDDDAIARILELKQRPQAKGLLLVAASLEQVSHLLKPLTSAQLSMLNESWPGHTTWVLPCIDSVSPYLRGEHNSVAVRVSAHPVVRALCSAIGPLVSTSANPAGRSPARSAIQVRRYFGKEMDYLVPGAVGSQQQPSEIRTLDGQRLR